MTEREKKSNAIQLEHSVSAWGTALTQLAVASGLNEEQVAEAARKGGVWRRKRNTYKLKRVRDLSKNVNLSDQLFLNYDADVLAQTPLQPTLVSDQLNYSIWDKPAGMLSQGSKWSDHCTITETVFRQHGKTSFLVHRLDKAASGLIVVAHTKNAVKKLAELFEQRLVEKHYRVTVHGKFELSLPYQIDATVEEKTAITDVLDASYDSATDTSVLLVNISTGRKHQIRNHLHSIGLPVVGDRLFDPTREHDNDLQLKASRLTFECPFTKVKHQFSVA